MARQTKQQRAAEMAVHDAFKRFGNGIEFDIFDISNITGAGIEAFNAGGNVDEAIKAAIEKYRKS